MIVPRWRTVQLRVTPYVVLALLVTLALAFEWGQWARLVPELILCVTTALWVLFWRDLRMPRRDRPAAIAVFMTGLIGLNLALVLLDGWFGFLCVATFTFAYTLVAWPWELLAVGATAVVAGIAQSSAVSGPERLLITAFTVAFNIVVMCGLSWGLRLVRMQYAQTATQSERSRLAREIHDTLAQGFAGIITQLQAAEQSADESERQRHTDQALALARDGLAEARRSVQDLRPVALDAVRLPDALRNVAREWSARTGIPASVKISGDTAALRTDAEVALLRTAQEALTNVDKHASARHVVLDLMADAHGCRLEVRDDGSGFDAGERVLGTEHPEQGGFGLTAMRERVEAVAGTFAVQSSPGHGTAVRAEVPA